jgi:hypothetical protein
MPDQNEIPVNKVAAAAPQTAFGARESVQTDAVPIWFFFEVPVTYAEAKALSGIKGTDSRPDLILRALLMRYIYGGEAVREAMLGGVSR